MDPAPSGPLRDNPVNVGLLAMLVISVVIFLVRKVRARRKDPAKDPDGAMD